ncbi:HU family DNA-binding protein [bacterium]|nr:HU family DNA-binding protein [bacterium]
MNKVEIVASLAERTGLTKQDAECAFDSLFDILIDSLAEGEKVVISGFGTFDVKQRKARDGHDPRSNEKIHIPSIKAATFKPGKVLKERVR